MHVSNDSTTLVILLYIAIVESRERTNLPRASSAKNKNNKKKLLLVGGSEAPSSIFATIVLLISHSMHHHVIIIVDRDNNICHYVTLRKAGFAITLYYHPPIRLAGHASSSFFTDSIVM
jgi:FlaA1/EpsC-like NDP-sugar epimerase